MLRLREIRMSKNLTQRELSKRSGLSQSFIHDLESQNKQPTLKTLQKLSIALNIPVSELIKDKEEQVAWEYTPSVYS